MHPRDRAAEVRDMQPGNLGGLPGAGPERVDVSVVVPLANERETLEELFEQISDVITREGHSFEVIFIDDGSVDGSWDVVRKLRRSHDRVRGIRFRRNFRKAAALA